jgi:hypothetical protein
MEVMHITIEKLFFRKTSIKTLADQNTTIMGQDTSDDAFREDNLRNSGTHKKP